MSSLASAEQEKLLMKPLQKMEGHIFTVNGILRLPGGRRIISCSWPDGSLRVWDLESRMQVGEAWKDEGSGAVRAIALSPDGKKVANGSQDGAVRLWDIDTGKVVKKWTGHTNFVLSICWSPDGGRVVSGSCDGTIRVWDVESGKTIIGPIKTEGSTVWAVCYSPDGAMIAAGTPWVEVWNANTGELLKTLDLTDFILCLAWTSDGKTLIIAGGFGKIRKFDTATWTEIAVLDGHKTRVNVNAISLSPNERILASVSDDQTARLWNLETNQPIGPPLHHENIVQSAVFSADGKFLVTGCFCDHYIYKWDVPAIIKKAGLDNLLCDNVVQNAANKLFIDADVTRRARIENARRIPPGFFDDARDFSNHRPASTRQQILGRLPSFWRSRSNPHGAIDRNAQSRSGPLSWAQDCVSGTLRMRAAPNIQSRELPLSYHSLIFTQRNYHARKKAATSSSRPPNTHVMQQPSGVTQGTSSSSPQSPAITTAAASLPAHSGTAMATGTPSHLDITITQAGCWTRLDLENGTQVGEAWQDEGSGGVKAMALSPDGKKVASGSEDGAVRLWDIDMGKVIEKWSGHTKIVRSVCWSRDGGRLASGSEDGTVRVWNVESGKTIFRPIKTGNNLVFAVCYSPDGKMIATGGGACLEIWDANTGKLFTTIREGGWCLAWTLDGKTLIAGTIEIRKFDTATWTEIAVLEGHEKAVNAISLSSNGRILASVSYDKTARLWNLEDDQPIGQPLHHEDIITSTAFSADVGKSLTTGGAFGHIYTWDVFAIVREAGLEDLLSENNDVNKSLLDADAQRRAPQINNVRRIPPGFFDDFSTSRSIPSHGQRDHRGGSPSSRRRRSHPRGERDTQSRSRPLSWAKNLISGILRDIKLQAPPVVDVPLTAGKPRNYHARRKKAASTSRPPNPHTAQ
ncbi:WD40-repeat-containing domain protein [Suillus ampliporus]|nr:WD40-repeat-containing domain protein [Suillus ampliporus]